MSPSTLGLKSLENRAAGRAEVGSEAGYSALSSQGGKTSWLDGKQSTLRQLQLPAGDGEEQKHMSFCKEGEDHFPQQLQN